MLVNMKSQIDVTERYVIFIRRNYLSAIVQFNILTTSSSYTVESTVIDDKNSLGITIPLCIP